MVMVFYCMQLTLGRAMDRMLQIQKIYQAGTLAKFKLV